MANKYVLDKGLDDSFDYAVVLDGKTMVYTVKYPSQKQLRPIQTGYTELQRLEKEYDKIDEDDKKAREEIEKKAETTGKEIADAFAALFTPHDDALPIAELLDELPSNKKRVFDLMIQAELLDSAEAKSELKKLGM